MEKTNDGFIIAEKDLELCPETLWVSTKVVRCH